MAAEAGAPRPPGLAGSISRLARTALAVLRTRLEILATEIEEERIRFAGLALVVAAIAFCLQMAVLLGVILMVVLLWETHRVVTLGVLSGAFLVAGVALYLWLRHQLRDPPAHVREHAGRVREGRRAARPRRRRPVNPHRLAQIHARRERLLAKAAAQRDEVALLLAPWQAPLAVADKGLTVAAYLREHPSIVIVAVAALVVLSPKRAFAGHGARSRCGAVTAGRSRRSTGPSPRAPAEPAPLRASSRSRW